MPSLGPGKSLTVDGYSSVFPKIIWSQAIYIKVAMSLTKIVWPTIDIQLSVFAIYGWSKLMVGCEFICMQRKIVFENITKELIRIFWEKQSSVIIKNKTQ